MISLFKSTKVLAWVILLVLVLTWGSSFILIKRGLEVFSPSEVGALRVSIAFIVLIPFTIKCFTKFTSKQWKYLIFVSITANVPAFLFPLAQTGIDSLTAGILNSMTPLFTLIIGLLFFKYRSKWYNILGVMIGLAGVIGLLSVSGGKSFEFNINYGIYIIIATFCYSLSINIIKYYLNDINSISLTSITLFITGLPIMIYLIFFTDFFHQMQTEKKALIGLGYLTILSVLGTVFALIAFYRLVQITDAVFASSVTYMIPIVAVLWGIFDGEIFKLIYFIWIILILFGVLLVKTTRIKKFFLIQKLFLWLKRIKN